MGRIQLFDHVSGKVIFSHECDNNSVAKTLRFAASNGADLSNVFLCDADLRGADLRDVGLRGADLRDANLYSATLCNVDLRGADLRGAVLCYADLGDADLRDADLRYADLHDANLFRADLRGANLRRSIGLGFACPTEGEFIGWKKASNFIVKLLIPADALRSSATSTKCRCNKAFVLDIQNGDGSETDVYSVASNRDSMFKYVRNSWVEVNDFDTNRWNECAPGIHFFVDRQEAVDYE